MDLLAQTYEGPAEWFTSAGPHVRLRWYYCDPDAEMFPYPHVFGAGNYDAIRGIHPGKGDIPNARRLTRDFFAPYGATGKHFCGPLEWFQSGIPLETLGTVYPRNAFGLLTCCNPDEVDGQGGAGEESAGGGTLEPLMCQRVAEAAVPPFPPLPNGVLYLRCEELGDTVLYPQRLQNGWIAPYYLPDPGFYIPDPSIGGQATILLEFGGNCATNVFLMQRTFSLGTTATVALTLIVSTPTVATWQGVITCGPAPDWHSYLPWTTFHITVSTGPFPALKTGGAHEASGGAGQAETAGGGAGEASGGAGQAETAGGGAGEASGGGRR